MGSSSWTFELSCTQSKHDVIGRHRWFLPRHDEPPHFLQSEVSGGAGDALASQDDARLFSSRVRCHGDGYSPTGLSQWWISDPNIISLEWDSSQSEVPVPTLRVPCRIWGVKKCASGELSWNKFWWRLFHHAAPVCEVLQQYYHSTSHQVNKFLVTTWCDSCLI